ncbi:hypothetical protein [uncultured Litoreibacter sp.]|uniref:hypothetical protein n=1 Tax=uncultured Litoreibacter sp. TaxID=1392394 RepID=UPI002632A543|nr:hypothetical protein [uncultured Litoreibacter sp.]
MFEIHAIWLVSDSFYQKTPQLPEDVDAQISELQSYIETSLADRGISMSLLSPELRVRDFASLGRRVASANFAVIDLTLADLNLACAIGYIKSKGLPVIFIQSEEQENVTLAGVVEADVVRFRSYQTIPLEMYSWVLQTVRQLVHEPRVTETDIHRLWFPEDTKEVTLVAATEDNPTPYIDATSPFYIYLDTLIDRDTLLGTSSFLSRFYPRCDIKLMAAERFSHGTGLSLERDLVVVGGPGIPDDNIEGNSASRQLFEAIQSDVSYSKSGKTISFSGEKWRSKKDKKGRLLRDVGLFARFPNPFNPKFSVVMLHGMYTLGVLGAFRAFSEHPLAYNNVKSVLKEFGPNGAFEAAAYVNILEGEVICPTQIVAKPLSI